MPPIPDPRPGQLLQVKGRPLPFSMWPVGRGIRRYGLSDYLFAKSPWAVVRGAVESHAPASRVREASAFVDQAENFFEAAQSREPSFTPLLFYYSFLNLAKAFILARGQHLRRQRDLVTRDQATFSVRFSTEPRPRAEPFSVGNEREDEEGS